ncbi:MAG: hypothetical protein ACTSVY_07025 [Candidatus Helarchaeota archaeon]
MTELPKAKVAFMQLSSCWGCHQSLLDAEDFLEILPLIDIVYWPAVVDFKHDSLKNRKSKEIDVGFIEGMIRTHEDLENTKLIREKCKFVIAFGACACFGGIPGLANLFTKEELVDKKYKTADTIVTSGLPKENVPEFEASTELVSDIIDVDYFIPGCPPLSEQITGFVKYLYSYATAAKPSSESVCVKCSLKGSKCLLNEGKLCFGPITGSGIDEKYTAKGLPSLGTGGPTQNVSDKEATLLTNMLIEKENLTETEINNVVEFLILFLKLPNFSYIYTPNDPLQRLYTVNHREKPIQTTIVKSGDMEGLALDFPLPEMPQVSKNIIGLALYLLKNKSAYQFKQQTVCATCERKKEDKTVSSLKRDHEGIKDPDTCLLEQGYICLGIVTKAGCGCICPNAGSPCLGCYGKAANILDPGAKMISAIASISTELTVDEILDKVVDAAGLFYRFTLPASLLHKKIEDKGD